MPRDLLATLLGAVCIAAVAPQATAGSKPTAVERAQLPTYCYAQMVDEKLEGQPGYSMPRSCGSWMNHFCGGYVWLIRARSPTHSSRERRKLAVAAMDQFNYTLRHMTENCPLRSDVDAALLEAKAIAGKSK